MRTTGRGTPSVPHPTTCPPHTRKGRALPKAHALLHAHQGPHTICRPHQRTDRRTAWTGSGLGKVLHFPAGTPSVPLRTPTNLGMNHAHTPPPQGSTLDRRMAVKRLAASCAPTGRTPSVRHTDQGRDWSTGHRGDIRSTDTECPKLRADATHHGAETITNTLFSSQGTDHHTHPQGPWRPDTAGHNEHVQVTQSDVSVTRACTTTHDHAGTPTNQDRNPRANLRERGTMGARQGEPPHPHGDHTVSTNPPSTTYAPRRPIGPGPSTTAYASSNRPHTSA